jgi:DNA processing protein
VSPVGAACPRCLRRSLLIGELAPRIAGLLGQRAHDRPRGLLGLAEADLLKAVVPAGSRARVERAIEGLDPDAVGEELYEAGLDAVCLHAGAYPEALADTSDPPPVLWLLGHRERFEAAWRSPTVTIVGSRKPSSYGREAAYALARDLGSVGVNVVSGLALGIDAEAHRGALDAGGVTIAVMANGPDIPYPRTNAPLWRRIAESGSVVAELPPGRRPYRWSFPARNRIMAALGDLTVVVEAAERSGSMITAELAQDLGRTLGAVPGRVTSSAAAGSNALLRDGAAVIRGPQDALDELAGASAGALGPERALSLAAEVDRETLDGAERRVLEAVESEEGVEAIGRRARLGASDVRRALARLEGHGLVMRDALGRYLRRAGG